MTWTLIAETKIEPTGSSSGGTSPAIDTTGADLIVWCLSGFVNNSFSRTDSEGNTWLSLLTESGSNARAKIDYSHRPTTSAAHAFTLSAGSMFLSATIQAWAGSTTTPGGVVDGQSAGGTANGTTTVQPGGYTPGADGRLFVTTITTDSDPLGNLSIDSGFTISNRVPYVAGDYFGSASAYFVQGAAGAKNPTWSDSLTPFQLLTTMAAFVPDSAIDYTLSANHGSFTETGEPAAWGYGFVGATGAYALTGFPANLNSTAPYITAEAGHFTLTGYDADFRLNDEYTLNAMTGNFVLTGNRATMCKAKAWPQVDCSDSPWTAVRC